MLAWNAIVKNEAARIERCVNSLLPHVDAAIVVDTGSTDGTPEKIQELFAAAHKPVEIHHAAFKNFSQARNEALAAARASALAWDYLLLADADMELVVDQPLQLNGGLAYDMRQTAGAITYWNRRVLSRKARGNYLGVTHEYLDVGPAERIDGAYFVDHADGSNRDGKLARDAALLEEALTTETNPGLIQRYHFYLAQSYFDQKDWAKAAQHYRKRAELGGWDEEVWTAQFQLAHALGHMGNKEAFVWELLQAYEMRPQRAESLYDLARFFRELSGANMRSLLFSEAGLGAPKPNELLFLNDAVYQYGLREEFSICAYYDPVRRAQGAKVCNGLTLDRNVPEHERSQARRNLYWYLGPLSDQVPSFTATKIDFTPPDGYAPMNPSVINHNGTPLVLIRTVNYRITPEGRYVSRDGECAANGIDIIRTRNFLCRLLPHGAVEHAAEILPDLPVPPKYDIVRGFEDSRLFEWNGQLWTLSTVRELTPEGWCEQVLAPIEDHGDKLCYGVWKVINPFGRIQSAKQNEKNWMPWVRNDELEFVYRPGTVIDVTGSVVARHEPRLALDHVSGGSQVINVGPGLYLALVHEAGYIPGQGLRFYQHRFITFTGDGSVLDISAPFYFQGKQIEFAAGMARFGDELMISYGVRDEEAWVARMRLDEVLQL